MSLDRLLLSKVSRSFAISAQLLDKSMKKDVTNQYLILRLLDTIEDSSLGDERPELMHPFYYSIERFDFGALREISEYVKGHVENENEVFLLENSSHVLMDFVNLEKSVQDIALRNLREMKDGMIKYLYKSVETFKDLDDYCYFVAGTVGKYLTDVSLVKEGLFLPEKESISSGRYLQKINIIKDLSEDLAQGRRYWPLSLGSDKHLMNGDGKAALIEMIRSAYSEVDDVKAYVASIPKSGYRDSSVVISLLAAKTLALFDEKVFLGPVKVQKSEVMKILFKTRLGFYDNNDRFVKEFDSSINPYLKQ